MVCSLAQVHVHIISVRYYKVTYHASSFKVHEIYRTEQFNGQVFSWSRSLLFNCRPSCLLLLLIDLCFIMKCIDVTKCSCWSFHQQTRHRTRRPRLPAVFKTHTFSILSPKQQLHPNVTTHSEKSITSHRSIIPQHGQEHTSPSTLTVFIHQLKMGGIDDFYKSPICVICIFIVFFSNLGMAFAEPTGIVKARGLPSASLVLPPLVVGQPLPEAYLIHAGYTADFFKPKPVSKSGFNKRWTTSVCQTSGASPQEVDVQNASIILKEIGGYSSQNSNTGSYCTVSIITGSATIALCGTSGFKLLNTRLAPYVLGIGETCQRFDLGRLTGGYQPLNENLDVLVVVFHS